MRVVGVLLCALAIGLGIGFLYDRYQSGQGEVVNVYSSRKEELLRDLFRRFTAGTGIRVRYINDEAAQLIARMESEGKYSKADVFLTADAVNLILAKKRGLLQAVKSDMLEQAIPLRYRDAEGYWFGLTKRARVVVYNKSLVSVGDLSTYEDLAHPRWKGKILVRSSNSPYNQSLIAFMVANNGLTATRKWIRGLVANFARKPSGGDTDQIYAAAAGEGGIAIVNSYYWGRVSSSDSKADREASSKLAIFFPNQKVGMGTMVNISGGAVAKHAKNLDNAVKLLEFLSGPEAQKVYADVNQEYPIVKGVEYSDVLRSWGEFRESELPLQDLEAHLAEAVLIADEEGWK
ncbi:extracellular solute-binding protein [Anaplasma capra]|uniref:extracellular solute-binding protein n=1 Tax=Anaplasma capra TaxID=1562740 RepID=UPI0021D60C30|nr:extracellular solute-binding protein [Anaplasma capra]MCU7611254.1 extracellular solute-binding protein [Anaplasma capra]MCU7612681.1 extracellular solute-binding protein [Anaplasma capra]